MKKAILALSLILLSGCNPITAATSLVSSPDEWEYLVVSPGKVYFDPSTSTSKQHTVTDEASGTELSFDILGKDGWELVTSLGAIGGDQEFVFKRKKKK